MRRSTALLLAAGLLIIAIVAICLSSSAESIDVAYGTTPTVDGQLSPNEWTDARSVQFAVGTDTGTVYYKHDTTDLYLAYHVAATGYCELFLDVDNDDASAPQLDDWTLHASAALGERTGNGAGWNNWVWNNVNGWTATTGFGQHHEWRVSYTKLGITAETPKTLGVAFKFFTQTNQTMWPYGSRESTPSSWADMNSSDEWGTGIPNKPPALSNGIFTPSTGDTMTVFRFEVTYRDLDNEAAVESRIYLDGSMHQMATDSTGPWDNWVTYYYETTLPVSDDHRFWFVFSDGEDSVRLPLLTDTPDYIKGPVVVLPNIEPLLTDPAFSPATGTRLDQFNFSINYTDVDDDAAVKSLIYIDDSPNLMVGDHSSYSTGVTYRFTTALDLGTHRFYLLFSDGEIDVRFPTVGSLEGPTVLNLDPAAVIASPVDGMRYVPSDLIPFSALGSSDPESDDLSYSWGSDIDALLSQDMLFDRLLSEGNHTITLTVTDEYGGTSSVSINVLVKPALPNAFMVGHEASLDEPTETDTMVYTVTVDNDGEADALGIQVAFLLDGIELSVDTISVTVGTPVEVVFTWVTEVGDHIVTFQLGDDEIEFIQHVNANTLPTAELNVTGGEGDPPRYRVGHELSLRAGVGDAEGDALELEWTLGDGTTVTDEVSLTHSYASPGTYQVKLEVTDSRGGTTVETVVIEVHANRNPVIDLEVPTKATKGKTVAFSVNVSDPDGDTWTLLWEFGDGTTSTGVLAEHVYGKAATYTVNLTVTDSDGGVSEQSFQLVVKRPKEKDGSPGPSSALAIVALAGTVAAMSMVGRHRARRDD